SLIPVLKGVATALQTKPLDAVPVGLVRPLEQLWQEKPKDFLVLEVLARMNHQPVRASLRGIVADDMAPDGEKIKAIGLLKQVRDAGAKGAFLAEFESSKSDVIRSELLSGLEAFDDPAIGDKILA